MTAPHRSGHYPALDGLRGIAILLVMMMHYLCVFEPWTLIDNLATKAAGLGWMGVDLFFALSGFLITGILLDTKRSPSYWRTFVARRAARIFPLYFLYVGAVAVTAYWISPRLPGSEQWIEAQGWYWSYLVNFFIAGQGDWASVPLHTGQLWSLAIEEQFYLIWPLLVLKLSREALLKVSLCVVSAALTLRIGLSVGDVNPVAIFVLTPTRVDALVAGAIVAILVRSGVEARAWPIFTGGAIVLAVILLQASTSQYKPLMQTIGFSALSLTFAGVIHWVVQHGNRPLSAPVLQFFGRYSYALYLLHGFAMVCVMELWPIAESHNIVIHWIVLRALLATGLAVAFALASWHLIEKWFLALKPSYEKEQTAGTEAEMVGAAGIGTVNTIISRTN